ncbi:MAG: peptide ABC transporter substrate-binding protein, partial [Culicoidibacterales bacterium]
MSYIKKIVGVVMSVVILASCGGAESKPKDNILKVATELKSSTIFHQETSEIANFDHIGQFLEGLVEYDLEKKIVPAGAESWTLSGDAKSYTFKLRRDAIWSNNVPVMAKDYVYSWRTLVNNEKADYRFLAAAIKNGQKIMDKEAAVTTLGVRAIDDYTLEVELEQPLAYFLDYLAFPTFFPLNEDEYQKIGAANYGTSAETVLANGPFIVERYTPDAEVIFKKNDKYWGKKNVKLAGVNVKIIAETSTQATLFDQGDLDVLRLEGDLIDKYTGESTIISTLQSRIDYMYISGTTGTPDALLSNQNFRLAVGRAIDKDLIVNNILKNGSARLDGLVPSEFGRVGDQFYREFAKTPETALFDKTKALEYLSKAKAELGATPLVFTLLHRDLPNDKKVYENLKAQIETNLPGVVVNLESMPNQLYFRKLKEKRTVAAGAGWSPDYFDVSTYFDLFTEKSPYNYANIQDKVYQENVSKAGSAELVTDVQKRAAHFVEAEKSLLADGTFIPLYQTGRKYNIKPYVKNYQLAPISPTVYYKNVELV